MPELPEVEVSRLGISPHITDQVVTKVIVRNGRLRWLVPDEVQLLVGQTVKAVTRRAKYLFIETQAGSGILHLGMSGKLRVVDKDVELVKHDHIDIEFSNGKVLRYNDARRFGSFLWQQPNTTHKLLTKLGPEPLTDEFDANVLFDQSRGKNTVVKNFIMDNHIVVGVGNIYANESLFKAAIDPRKPAGKITKKKYAELTVHIKQTLEQAIKQGGTTLKDFTQSDGSPGYFAQELLVYARAGKECLTCQTIIESVKIGQRNSFYCPSCQG
jgi:formamidopyrimidine-DNA glycosylase